MDVYGVPAGSGMDYCGMDDLLDLSNDDQHFSTSSSATTTDSDLHYHPFPTSTYASASASGTTSFDAPPANYNFNDVFCVPSDDAAELEWLSKYMDDSITDFPANSITSAAAAFRGSTRSVRSRSFSSASAAAGNTWSSTKLPNNNVNQRENLINGSKESTEKSRRCTHCSSEKTPQWRTGPLGPKTLCNACGVRYKSGRLVPEYRPAASPTFVLTQHSNSHRKVIELRRQKELLRQQQQLQSQRRNDITFRSGDVM